MNPAGALQMLFLLYACEASTPIDHMHRMSLPQLKAMLHAAKVTSNSLQPEQLDELFTTVQASSGALSRQVAGDSTTECAHVCPHICMYVFGSIA